MVIGWSVCTLALLLLVNKPLPQPYWCVGDDGQYVREVMNDDGTTSAADPCNPNAAEEGGPFALLMMLASLGYCIADVAADGLTVTLARQEPAATRGRTQTTVYLVRTCGNVVAVAVVGLLMNSYLYNGSFSWGLSYSSICGIFAIPSAAMIPVSWRMVHEPRMAMTGPVRGHDHIHHDHDYTHHDHGHDHDHPRHQPCPPPPPPPLPPPRPPPRYIISGGGEAPLVQKLPRSAVGALAGARHAFRGALSILHAVGRRDRDHGRGRGEELLGGRENVPKLMLFPDWPRPLCVRPLVGQDGEWWREWGGVCFFLSNAKLVKTCSR